MFSRLLIGKIEMTHFSGLSHSIEIFKYYKNMSFSKIKNTGHCIDKTIQSCSCFTSILMFSRLLIGKIEMTHFSGLSHSIEIFKYYKNISFSKIKNTGHCGNHRQNHSKSFTFILMFSRLLIGKIEMTHFSGLSHSIVIFKYYKNMSFSKIKNTGHCANHRQNHSKLLMFYIYSYVISTFDWEN